MPTVVLSYQDPIIALSYRDVAHDDRTCPGTWTVPWPIIETLPSSVLAPTSNGLHPSSFLLVAMALQPTCHGLQPNSDGLHPSSFLLLVAMASNLLAMASNPIAMRLHPSSFLLVAMASNLACHGLQPNSDGLHPSSFLY